MNHDFPLITVLGPTAAGKTAFAARLALSLNAEIISADSRQVYRGMDIGTGKDINDYTIDGKHIATHLIDIAEPGTEYNAFQFRNDFIHAWNLIVSRNRIPIMCGGTGMYLETILKGYDLTEVPLNQMLRDSLIDIKDEELVKLLVKYRQVHNTTDIMDRERLVRAIEIATHKSSYPIKPEENLFTNTPVIGLRFDRSVIRHRITTRLQQRLDEGMIEEVQKLLNHGVGSERLKQYGLEYKYVVMFLAGELKYLEMFNLLNTAIHQFAKRQMTWFRRMEKNGIKIYWLEGEEGIENNLYKAHKYLQIRSDVK